MIPVAQMVYQSPYTATSLDCDLYMTQLDDYTEDAIRLGDPFFSSFLPVFDVDNDQLGLALAARALDGCDKTIAFPPTPPKLLPGLPGLDENGEDGFDTTEYVKFMNDLFDQ